MSPSASSPPPDRPATDPARPGVGDAHQPAGPASDAGAAEAARIADDVEHGSRHPAGWQGALIAVIAGAWSVFHLSLASVLTLGSDQVRAIHLVFALVLVYLCFPVLRKRRPGGRLAWMGATGRVPVVDIVLGLLAGLAAAWYAIDYEGIAVRQGAPSPLDIVAGLGLIVLLLEAARRSMGLALPVVASAFIVYGLVGSYMPQLLAFKSVSLRLLVNKLTMTSEGIYGVPLRVSAHTVFLFVLLGSLLDKTGGGAFFVQLAFSLLGRFRGGPAKAAVLASGLTGLVSGSSIANTVTTGTFTIPLMKRCGYPAVKAAAVEVAASTNGQLMPPIMGAAAFIIAEYCRLPYLAVVRAAFIPAVISYIALIYITHLEAGKLGLKGMPASELPRFFVVLAGGWPFLIPLGMLVGLLLRGFSPQMAAFWGIVVLAGLTLARAAAGARRPGRSLTGELSVAARALTDGMVSGAKGMMAVAVACAAAGIVVGVVGLGPGQRITHVVEVLSGGSMILVLVITAAASLLLGMGLPTTATYIVMASLIAHVIVYLGAANGVEVPLIAAHLFCFYFGILADDTPPVGLAAYAAAAVARSDPIKTGIQGFTYDLRTAILPFIFVFNTDLLLWGITAWWHIGLILLTSTTAMLAFAALTQHYMVTRNRPVDVVLLGASTLVLLRPQLIPDLLAGPTVQGWLDGWPGAAGALAWPGLGNRFAWYGVGLALFAAAQIVQRRRVARRHTARPALD